MTRETEQDREDLEAAQAYQQSMDEQSELLAAGELKEYKLWSLKTQLLSAIADVGLKETEAVVAEVMRVEYARRSDALAKAGYPD